MDKVYVVMEGGKYEVISVNVFSTLENAEKYIISQFEFDEQAIDELEHAGYYAVGNHFTLFLEEVPIDKIEMHVTGDGIVRDGEPANESKKWKKI